MGLTDTSDLLRCIGMCSVRILEIRPSQYLIAYRLVKLCLPPSPSLVNAHLSLPKTVQLTLEASKHGLGRHGWDVPIDELPRLYTVSITALSTSQIHVDSSNQYTKMSTVMAMLSILAVKLSLLLLYFHLFSPNKVTKYLILFGIAFCLVVAFGGLLATSLVHGKGGSYSLDTVSALNVFGDLYILCIPIAAVSKLNLPPKKKLGIILIFLTGLL